MIGFLKRQSPFSVPLIILLGFFLKMGFISHPLPREKPSSGGLMDTWLLQSAWLKLHPSFLAAIAILILFISAFYLNFILSQQRMLGRNQYLPALSLILFTSVFPHIQQFQSGLVLLPVTLLLYQQMLALYNTGRPRTTVVNIGLITGTGYLLYHPYWWMLLAAFWALGLMRPARATEWMLLLVSFLTPAYFLLAYEYLTNQWQPQAHWPVWNPLRNWPAVNPWWTAAAVTTGIWFITGLAQWQQANRRMLIQTRKNWYLLLIIGLFTVPTLFFPQGNLYEGLSQLSIPVAAFGAFAFAGEQNRLWQSLLCWIVAGTAAAMWYAVRSGQL